MMVTFVSQCQKKSLTRTRRVLDAFANRIGDNTWQTVITEDGLIAVKKLLRKSASKNTAVSCHWIRSRSRSELVWVVGNRSQFSQEGIVPVNSTSKEVFMDIKQFKPNRDIAYANSKFQRLDEHLFAVGYLGLILYKKLVNAEPNHAEAIYFSGLLHDIGKNEINFQSFIREQKLEVAFSDDGQHIEKRGVSFNDFPRHNELSALMFHMLNDIANQRAKPKIEQIAHVIYWHHAKPFRDFKKASQFESYRGIAELYFSKAKSTSKLEFFSKQVELLSQVDLMAKQYDEHLDSVLGALKWIKPSANEEFFISDQSNVPVFKKYNVSDRVDFEALHSDIRRNAINNIMRTCVITADRIVSSSYSGAELSHSIKNKTLIDCLDNVLETDSNLCNEIADMLQNQIFDVTRNERQAEAAIKLSKKSNIAVLAGAAGCGKTKIALEWANLRKVKKLLWICPRVQVCQGVFKELTEFYLPNSDIEIYTGEFKFHGQWENVTPQQDELRSEIIVTTIDQILNAVTSHTKVDLLIDFLNAHVVFDEYHEFANMPAFNLLFAELIEVKKLQNNQTTLLVSATPNPVFLEKVLGIDSEKDVVVTPSFNQCLYQIEVVEYEEGTKDEKNPFFSEQQDQTFVISNTAQTAQISFIQNQHKENSILFHSKFKRSDKKFLFNEVYEAFMKNGDQRYAVLRSGPIVQASLNISCQHMVSEITTPENMLQRMGRLDRFGQNLIGVNLFKLAIPKTFNATSKKGNCAGFLSRNNELQITQYWLAYLKDKLPDTPYTLEYLYELYSEFYKANLTNKDLIADIGKALNRSGNLINKKVTDPILIRSKNANNESNVMKSSSKSLRGNNVFVQMAKCDLENSNLPRILNEYAYFEPLDDKTPIDNLSASVDFVTGYNHKKPEKDLVNKMYKVHHNIKGGGKPYNPDVLIKEAKSSDYPIYLSYTNEDIKHFGGNDEHAIFYCFCSKQVIGTLDLSCLTNGEDDSDE